MVSLVIMHCRHRHNAVKLFQEDEVFSWTEKRFCVRLLMWTDGVKIRAAEAMKLSEVSNSSTSTVRKDTFFVDIM